MFSFWRKLPVSWDILQPEDVGFARDDLEAILDMVKLRHDPDGVVSI